MTAIFSAVLCIFTDVVVAYFEYCWLILGGKRDEKLILPINGSISMTLGLQHVCL